MGLLEHRSSAAAGGPVNGVDGSVYRPKQTYISPSHNSKTVLCIVKIGPPSPSMTAAGSAWSARVWPYGAGHSTTG